MLEVNAVSVVFLVLTASDLSQKNAYFIPSGVGRVLSKVLVQLEMHPY